MIIKEKRAVKMSINDGYLVEKTLRFLLLKKPQKQ